jgi:hypothetical protein
LPQSSILRARHANPLLPATVFLLEDFLFPEEDSKWEKLDRAIIGGKKGGMSAGLPVDRVPSVSRTATVAVRFLERVFDLRLSSDMASLCRGQKHSRRPNGEQSGDAGQFMVKTINSPAPIIKQQGLDEAIFSTSGEIGEGGEVEVITSPP